MSLRQKVILASMIIRGAASFGLMAYAMFNFARWLLDNSQDVDEALTEEILELRFE